MRGPRPSHHLVCWLIGLLVAALSACGGGGGGSSPASLYPLWVPTDVLVADIDGDGRRDVVTLAMLQSSDSERRGHLLVYLQTAPGVFAAPLTTLVGAYPWRMAIGDLDGDGAPDLAIAEPDARVTWLLRQDPAQRGRFLPPQALLSGAMNYGVAIADLNGDGVPDVAASDTASGALRLVVRHQDAANRGSFAPQLDLAVPGTAGDVAAGDVDGDGRADLLVWIYTNPPRTYPPSGELVVLFQKAGGFDLSARPLAPLTGLNAHRLAIQDADGDGRADLLAYLTPFSSDYRALLVVVPQPSARSFGAAVATSLSGIDGIDDATFADLNRDGRPDAAVAGFFPVGSPSVVRSQTNLLLNSGAGRFGLAGTTLMPLAVSVVTAGDLDADGANDLVLLGSGNACLVMMQSSTPGSFLAPRALR